MCIWIWPTKQGIQAKKGMFTVGQANKDFCIFFSKLILHQLLFWASYYNAIIAFIRYEFAKNFQKNLIAYPNVQAALKSAVIKFDKLDLT